MPSNRTLIRIFVAFPSDVREERMRLYQVVKELNDPGGTSIRLVYAPKAKRDIKI